MPCVTVRVIEPAKFSITNVRVEPTQPTTADTIKVYATLSNSGGVGGTANIKVTVDGSVVKTDSEYVEAGSSKTISYEISKLSAGTHTICVDLV